MPELLRAVGGAGGLTGLERRLVADGQDEHLLVEVPRHRLQAQGTRPRRRQLLAVLVVALDVDGHVDLVTGDEEPGHAVDLVDRDADRHPGPLGEAVPEADLGSRRVDEHARDDHAVLRDVEQGDLLGQLIGGRDGRGRADLLGDLGGVDGLAGRRRLTRRALGDVALGHIDGHELGVVVRPSIDALHVVVDEQGRDDADQDGAHQDQRSPRTHSPTSFLAVARHPSAGQRSTILAKRRGTQTGIPPETGVLLLRSTTPWD